MATLPPILIVDDNGDVRHAARLAFEPHVSASEAVGSPDEAAALLVPGRFGCVLLDMNYVVGERRLPPGSASAARPSTGAWRGMASSAPARRFAASVALRSLIAGCLAFAVLELVTGTQY